ncbi:FHA domain-containing protein [Vibrio mangrovi]|uniref:FHA domain-containing protein n=1 Tax=Vibrio mangrovi TaxID=474394 RepID=A0A1Y6IXT4_9VIBR|nr:FHA domain-containing protein [Vibrio mangrovi]MDW6001963.1 FHA domain-containing protein [Vibrio mangrovi]SMS02489.1 hypothetical protein VIM7927_03822 [Vibrio mangrovi]
MYELRVLNGLHRGAALPLIGNQWSIGTEEDSDLVLFDPGIKPQHCRLSPTESGWTLSGEQGRITDTEGHRVDTIDELKPNTAFALNGIWMTIVEASTPWPEDDEEAVNHEQSDSADTASPQKKTSVIPFTLGFISAVTIVATSTWAALSPSEEQKVALDPPGAQQAWVSTKSAPQEKLDSGPELRVQLQKMLTERELDKAVSVRIHGDTVQLSGSLSPEQRDRLERMVIRFHEQFETGFQLDNQITSLSAQLPFRIVQITSGAMGSVVTSDGTRLFIGDELDGVRLVSIEPDKVTFKGKHNYEVRW